jgi:hypothetical protein
MEGDRRADASAPRSHPAEKQARKKDCQPSRVGLDEKMDEGKQGGLQKPRGRCDLDAKHAHAHLAEVGQRRLNVSTKERLFGERNNDQLS